MTQQPLVSIIIPCYNAAPRLEACLKSCLEQTYPNLEIIFVDNNSTDNSLEIAVRFQKIAPFPLQVLHCERKGANYARNMGFTHARGQYIQWLDADDELALDKLALQVSALAGAGAELIACADWEWHFYQEGQLQLGLGFAQVCWQDALLQGLIQQWHPPHAYLLHRAMAEQLHHLQAWYEGAAIANDTEYFLTAAIIGCRFLPVPGARVRYYTWSSSQLTMSTAYEVRVVSMQSLFERLRERLCLRPWRSISGVHWMLLRQCWELWELAPCSIQPLAEGLFWIEREDGVGMTLNAGEAQIATALNELQGIAAIDSHAYRVVRFLWQQVVLKAGVTPATVEKKLAQWVGLLPDEAEVVERKSRAQLSQEQVAMVSVLNQMPIHAPMFPEIRLTILQLLNRFQAVGLLQQRELSEILE